MSPNTPAPVIGTAFSRAGLMGNPADGIGGKAIACPVRNFVARVSVAVAPELVIRAGGTPVELPDLGSALAEGIHPAVGGLERLILAALRRFVRWSGPPSVSDAGLRIDGATTIPRQVGLAGSSAIIIATLRALSGHWDRPISRFDLAEMALATELEDLGIAAGAMDRVVQAYERVLAMELAPPRTEAGYRPLDPGLLPPLLIAWNLGSAKSSGGPHGDLRARWLDRDPVVMATVSELRDLVDRGVEALLGGDHGRFADLMDRNFQLRCRVFSVGEADHRMLGVAREAGGAGKLCGSGGAVVVMARPGVRLAKIERALNESGFPTCRVIAA